VLVVVVDVPVLVLVVVGVPVCVVVVGVVDVKLVEVELALVVERVVCLQQWNSGQIAPSSRLITIGKSSWHSFFWHS
jgi:hypothetical protein